MKHVLVTRPERQNGALVVALQQAGIQTYVCPLQAIVATNEIQINQSHCDLCIYTSVNAVRYGVKKDIPALAIGSATYQALQCAGVEPVAYPPAPYRSESLLELPILKQVQHKKICLIKGNDGRNILRQTLQQRGAIVEECVVYKRIAHPVDEAMLELFLQARGEHFVIMANAEIVDILEEQASYVSALKQQSIAVALSQRIGAHATLCGWHNCIVAVQSSSVGLKSIIKDYA